MMALHLAVLATLIDRPKRVVAGSVLYGATTHMLMTIFGALGVETDFVDMSDLAAIEHAFTSAKTGALVLETITNPLLRVPQMDKIAEIARKAEVPVIVDNTFATPMLMRPLELGAGIVIHSATKYLAGHGDALGGIVVCEQAHFEALKTLVRTIGPNLGPFEAYLTMRGIKTLAIRHGTAVPERLQSGGLVEIASANRPRPFSPGDPAHPDAATVERLLPKSMAGAMVAVELKDAGKNEVFTFMEKLKMIVRATSLGDVQSMVLYPAMASHRDLSPKHRERLGIGENLVRISVGIEAIDDIIADLDKRATRLSGETICLRGV